MVVPFVFRLIFHRDGPENVTILDHLVHNVLLARRALDVRVGHVVGLTPQLRVSRVVEGLVLEISAALVALEALAVEHLLCETTCVRACV